MGDRLELNTASSKNTKSLDDRNAREIEDLLTYLSLCESKEPDVPFRTLSGAYLYGDQSNMGESSIEEAHKTCERYGLTLDSKFVLVAHGEDCEYELCRVRQHSDAGQPKPWTGTDSWVYQRWPSVRVDIVAMLANGSVETRAGLTVFKKNKELLIPSTIWQYQEGLRVIGANAVLHQHALATEWSVRIRLGENMPSVGFFTDPTGIKELMKFRDKAEGVARRSAIVHWVTEHWRQHRDDPDVEVYVRKHLRGDRLFGWHGMGVYVVLPEADIFEVEIAKAARKRLSVEKLGRRLKAHRKAVGRGLPPVGRTPRGEG